MNDAGVNGEAGTGAYVRVSSRSQTHDTQRHAIETAARARDDDVGNWYAEKASGGRGRPPELGRVLADARAGKLRRLYVYRLDRLSRRGARDVLDLFHELESCNVEIVTTDLGVIQASPARDMILAALACAAAIELEAIHDRIDAAKERLAAQGRRFGRPLRMSEVLVDKARKLRDRGHSVRYISAALKVPRATIARALLRSVSKPMPKKATGERQKERKR